MIEVREEDEVTEGKTMKSTEKEEKWVVHHLSAKDRRHLGNMEEVGRENLAGMKLHIYKKTLSLNINSYLIKKLRMEW